MVPFKLVMAAASSLSPQPVTSPLRQLLHTPLSALSELRSSGRVSTSSGSDRRAATRASQSLPVPSLPTHQTIPGRLPGRVTSHGLQVDLRPPCTIS
eukprot:1317466-Rhodomonas_salina.1